MKEIYDLVLEVVGDNRDTLTEIMGRLSEYELFASKVNDPSIFLNNNYYFSLSGELDSTVRFTSIFLIINYIFNVFTNMGGTEVVNGNRSMRYVLMIDEAHDLFREKKSLEILEVLLRKIRSYGVSIVLLSQGISEYNQGYFDFSQECETAFLLPINDLSNTKAINKFLGLSEKDGSRTMRNLEKLDNGQCVSNIKELRKGDLFEVVQYWKENKTYKTEIDNSRPKFYVLDMFPYPSGAGLHVGHPLGYIASDIFSRYKRLQGYNVLHPMGYDAYGLPAEQYAIQTGQHPEITTVAISLIR